MSIDYNLQVTTELEPKEVLAVLLGNEEVAMSVSPNGSVSAGGPGLIAYARVIDVPEEALAFGLGITSSVAVTFQVIVRDYATAKAAIIKATVQWFIVTSEDAALLFNAEEVLVFKKAGKVVVNSSTDIWQPDDLRLLTFPYRTEHIPIL